MHIVIIMAHLVVWDMRLQQQKQQQQPQHQQPQQQQQISKIIFIIIPKVRVVVMTPFSVDNPKIEIPLKYNNSLYNKIIIILINIIIIIIIINNNNNNNNNKNLRYTRILPVCGCCTYFSRGLWNTCWLGCYYYFYYNNY